MRVRLEDIDLYTGERNGNPDCDESVYRPGVNQVEAKTS